MAETWVAIAADIRDAYSPITSDLLALYHRRDESLRESHCSLEAITNNTASSSWVILTDNLLWVPSWASKLSLRLDVETQNGSGANVGHINVSLSAGTESGEQVSSAGEWNTRGDITHIITVADADRGTYKELEINGKLSAGFPTVRLHVWPLNLWWHQ